MSFCVQSDARFRKIRMQVHLLEFNSVNVLGHAGRAFSAAAVLPVCGTRWVNLPQQSFQ